MIVNHKYLYVRDDNLEAEEADAIDKNNGVARDIIDSKKKSVYVKNVGSATTDTEITFEYGVLRKKNDKKDEKFEKLPFQLQIKYKALDGTEAVRVYTQELEFTRNRSEAEWNIIDEGIFLTHQSRMTSTQFLDHNRFASKIRNQAVINLMN